MFLAIFNILVALIVETFSRGVSLCGFIVNTIIVVESLFSSLKKERIRKQIYRSQDEARADIFDYIEVFYDRTRRPSHLDGMSPKAFERNLKPWPIDVYKTVGSSIFEGRAQAIGDWIEQMVFLGVSGQGDGVKIPATQGHGQGLVSARMCLYI